MLSYEGGQERHHGLRPKEESWSAKLKEIERIADALDWPIEEKVREAVVGLNLSGISTSASCEGHNEDGNHAAPWIDGQAPNRPQEQFVGESLVVAATAKKYRVPEEKVRRNLHHEAYREAHKSFGRELTPEYLLWALENRRLEAAARALLDEFYRDRTAEPGVRLIVEREARGFRIRNDGGREAVRNIREDSGSDAKRKVFAERLAAFQAELQAFADFLHKKYLDSRNDGGI